MTTNLPISEIEDTKKIKTSKVLNDIKYIHLYFREMNTINGLAEYKGFFGPYTINGIVDINASKHRYKNNEEIGKLDWWRLSIEIEVCGTLIYRRLMDNGVML